MREEAEEMRHRCEGRGLCLALLPFPSGLSLLSSLVLPAVLVRVQQVLGLFASRIGAAGYDGSVVP